MQENVILVDEKDQQIGFKEKLQAHLDGDLHRALSVFICNDKGQWLLQRRALGKYHSPGLWTNTCCSHPRPSEAVLDAANRRLKEEMGICTALNKFKEVTYRLDVGSHLIEHEFDHIFVGLFNGEPEPNPGEVCDWKWVDYSALKQDISLHPENYTAWFKLILDLELEALYTFYLSLPDQLSLVLSVEK